MKQRNFKFSPKTRTPLTVYGEPEKGDKYTIGIDTGGGVGLDYTVGVVLSNRLPFEQKAIWRSNKLRPAIAAEELAKLGWYYNNAFLVIESNAMGAGLLSCIADTHKYSNLFRKPEQLDVDPNVSDKLGWATTQTGKFLLITELQQAFREDALVLHDKTTVEELCQYIYIEDKAKTGTAAGLHDDCVIALMLALYGARLYPQKPKPKPKLQVHPDKAQEHAMMKKFMDWVKSPKKKEGLVM